MLNFQISDNGLLSRLHWITGESDIHYPLLESTAYRMAVSITGTDSAIDITTNLENVGESIEITIEATNREGRIVHCNRLRFMSGLDMLMNSYPEYLEKFMPTTIRVEQDHFWAVCGTPSGKWLSLVSPDQVDGFHIYYDDSFASISPRGVKSGGHQIQTFAVDLINAVDQRPSRLSPPNPLFQPGEKRTWRLFLSPLINKDEIGKVVAKYAKAPYLHWKRSGVSLGQELLGEIYVPKGEIPVVHFRDENADACVHLGSHMEISSEVSLVPFVISIPKESDFRGKDVRLSISGKSRSLEGAGYVFDDWEAYIHCASSFASQHGRPAATKVCEAAMPVFSLLGAQRLAPSRMRGDLILGFLEDELFRTAYSPDGKPRMNPHRIQNHSSTIDLCREAWLTTREPRWLNLAVQLAKYLLSCQGADGGFYAFGQKNHYTCVIYIAKSLLELSETLLAASRIGEFPDAGCYAEYARDIHKAVGLAMDDLYNRGTDVGTEGAPCYEDGAIACAALQLAQWSLKNGDPKYALLARELMSGHSCLEWISPDSTSNGASIRFWESFWAIGWKNCLNTPHGWSAWTAYAWYYLYLSTGDISCWDRFMNTLAACVHLINSRQGDVLFCFSPESHVYDSKGMECPGECYISPTAPGMYAEGGNETHEVSKLIMDTVLFQGFVYNNGNDWKGYGVDVRQNDDTLYIIPSSRDIQSVYINQHHGRLKIELCHMGKDIEVKWHGLCGSDTPPR